MRLFYILIITVFVINSAAEARPHRPNQIPNGNKNSCENCHTTSYPSADYLTPFGKEVRNNHLSNGDVVWSEALAMLDSDNDGFTNGQELQDPEGTWRIGDAQPGDINLVTNPGDETSFPEGTSVPEFFENYADIINISPNPVQFTAAINLNIREAGFLQVRIYNINGYEIANLYDGFTATGNLTLNWITGGGLPAGSYYIQFKMNNSARIEKVIVQ